MRPVENFKDRLLYIKISKKDKEAFIKAYDLHVDDIYRFVFFKVSDEDEARDISSSVFLKTWDYIQNNNLKDYKTLKSLFYKVARNLVIDHYRKKSTRQNDINMDRNVLMKENLLDESQDIVAKLEVKTEMDLVRKKISELKEEYQEAITLRFINELSIPEIARIMNKSRGNTRVLVFRAMNALRELVNQEQGFSGLTNDAEKNERKRTIKTIK